MALVQFRDALVQGEHAVAAALGVQPRENSLDTFKESKQGGVKRVDFRIEERLADGKVNFWQASAEGAVAEAVIANQWVNATITAAATVSRKDGNEKVWISVMEIKPNK